jgi:hypothetical protein
MDDDGMARIAEILHEAAETHHVVFAITDGADDDWATWYSDWLVNLSRLPELLGRTPVRSALTEALVRLDREYSSEDRTESWEEHYARELLGRFGGG